MFDQESYNILQMIDAITCPINRNGTREEHMCDDVELNKHPEWLLEHYDRSGGGDRWRIAHAEKTQEEYEAIREILFFFKDFTKQEILEIILDEKNRHWARTTYSCDDDELYFHPERLLEACLELDSQVSARFGGKPEKILCD